MDYTTEFDQDDDVHTIRVSGRMKRPNDSVALQELVRDIGRDRGGGNFLVDMTRAKIAGGPMDAFKAGQMCVDFGDQAEGYKIAAVYSGLQSDHKFMEAVAVNRGFRVRVFDDEAEALTWLRGADDAY